MSQFNGNAFQRYSSKTLLAALLAIALFTIFARGAQDQRCREKGFGSNLLCSTCAEFQKDVPDSDLVQDCKKCCTNDQSRHEFPPFQSVRLLTSPTLLTQYPQIDAFIKHHAKEWGISVVYVSYVLPRLELLDSKNVLVQALSLTEWTTDDVIDFAKWLKQKDTESQSV